MISALDLAAKCTGDKSVNENEEEDEKQDRFFAEYFSMIELEINNDISSFVALFNLNWVELFLKSTNFTVDARLIWKLL